jgi:hypothetical protein
VSRCDPPARRDHEVIWRDVIAMAIYERRPFVIAQSGGVLDMMRTEKVCSWDEAPGWYRSECWDLADAVHARLLLPETGAAPPNRGVQGAAEAADVEGEEPVRAALLRALAPVGAAKRLAAEAQVSLQRLSEMKRGHGRICRRVAAALGFRKVLRYEPLGGARAATRPGQG